MADVDALQSFADPALLAEPHAFLAELRRDAPVCEVRDPRGKTVFMVTSAALVEEATKRKEDFSNEFSHLMLAGRADEEVEAILAEEPGARGLLLINDEPAHKRYRAMVNAVFAQGRVANLGPTIEALVDELIDAMAVKGEADFVNEFAVLLPTYVIADILGMERKDYPLVRVWSDAVIRIISQIGTREQMIEAARHVVTLRRFIRDMVRVRRDNPSDDLISSLVNVRLDGMQPLTDEEASGLTLEIAVAGNETTRNTLMSGLVTLLRHPDQLQAIVDDPSLAANAVEELLRYETPATSMWRIANKDTMLGGVAIPAGAELLLRFDGANRDPARFENPDAFDIRRRNARMHDSFGAPGIHRCLGQMLARKELVIALPKLLTRLRNLRIDERSDVAYWPGLLHRGIGSLFIRFDAEPRA